MQPGEEIELDSLRIILRRKLCQGRFGHHHQVWKGLITKGPKIGTTVRLEYYNHGIEEGEKRFFTIEGSSCLEAEIMWKFSRRKNILTCLDYAIITNGTASTRCFTKYV